MTKKCKSYDKCVSDKKNCEKCERNFKFNDLKDYFQQYHPACPLGFEFCVNDPAYIKCFHPKYFKEAFGDKSIEEIVAETCLNTKHITNGFCPYYDDEDK